VVPAGDSLRGIVAARSSQHSRESRRSHDRRTIMADIALKNLIDRYDYQFIEG
jgi:hypothetical protein